jgi:ribosomal protein L12E/L44/L45/RPP1/RPP2
MKGNSFSDHAGVSGGAYAEFKSNNTSILALERCFIKEKAMRAILFAAVLGLSLNVFANEPAQQTAPAAPTAEAAAPAAPAKEMGKETAKAEGKKEKKHSKKK